MIDVATAISVKNVSKSFRLHQDRPASIKEFILQRGGHSVEHFQALKNISIDIPKGSFFGVIGHNGSGKSTLLRIMSGIHRPSSGTVESSGRISALLELGSGFHPELTGRENVYLNGAMLGIARKKMTNALDSIIEFSGIGEFIDSPVKVYSSGMYVRLGFAVAVHVDPEILLVDEVIAVGDEEFQRRCLDHMYGLRRRGKTIVFVSHASSMVERLCDEVAWLDHGSLAQLGRPTDVCQAYLSHVNDQETDRLEAEAGLEETENDADEERETRRGSGEIRTLRIEFLSGGWETLVAGSSGDPMILRLWYEAMETIARPVFGLGIHHEGGTLLAAPDTSLGKCETGMIERGTGYIDVVLDRLILMPGNYFVSTSITDEDGLHVFDEWNRSHKLNVQPGSSLERTGMLELGARWQTLVPLSDEP